MVIVKIIGGLGNQMFQYAYAKKLEKKGYEVKIDVSAFKTYKLHGGYQLDDYNIDLKESLLIENNKYYSNSIFSKVLKKIGLKTSSVLKEKSLLYNETFLKINDDNYVEGYFQSEKYFKDIRDVLLEQFIIKSNISNYTNEIKNKIKIHIRRGDFINNKNVSIHGSCDLEYYEKAIKYLNKLFPKMNYFVFSDDIDWCKKNMSFDNITYIYSVEKMLPHEDIYLMSLCNHNIIANSSFSWWGAWLNQNPEKIVISPKRWFADDELEKQSKDIICESWIRI